MQKGKEKLGIADEELKKSTIKLPVLEKLVKPCCGEHLEEKLKKKKKKKGIVALTEKLKKDLKVIPKNKNDNAVEIEFSDDNADEREFSRDFLEVVLMCLEEQKLTTAKQILEHPFFQKPVNLQKFERSMRSRNFH